MMSLSIGFHVLTDNMGIRVVLFFLILLRAYVVAKREGSFTIVRGLRLIVKDGMFIDDGAFPNPVSLC